MLNIEEIPELSLNSAIPLKLFDASSYLSQEIERLSDTDLTVADQVNMAHKILGLAEKIKAINNE